LKMPLWSRRSTAKDVITSDDLASWGRQQLLGEVSGVDSATTYSLIEPLSMEVYMPDGKGAWGVIEELKRHVLSGEWAAVGAWKFARDFLADVPGADGLIDAGLLAVDRMRITNLAIHLAPIDRPRYEELTGHAPPNDGFFGPPVFDSNFGPTRHLYFESAVAAAAARRITRLSSNPGIPPATSDGVANAMWDLGMLIFRGPLVVSLDGRFEPAVVRPAATIARDADHAIFAESLLEWLEPHASFAGSFWGYLGAGRFVEDYLDEGLRGSPAHLQLVDRGIQGLASSGLIGIAIAPGIMSPLEQERLNILSS
jgi:hypothetical protein